jgi:hypothetical protein
MEARIKAKSALFRGMIAVSYNVAYDSIAMLSVAWTSYVVIDRAQAPPLVRIGVALSLYLLLGLSQALFMRRYKLVQAARQLEPSASICDLSRRAYDSVLWAEFVLGTLPIILIILPVAFM